MQPIAELIWFREATRHSRTQDRMKALPESPRAYHAFGTTSVFEGHGAATELLRLQASRSGMATLTMRTALAFSPELAGRRRRASRALRGGLGGWLGEPGFGDDWLKMSGLYLTSGASR